MDKQYLERYHQGKLDSLLQALEEKWPGLAGMPQDVLSLTLLSLFFCHRYERLVELLPLLPERPGKSLNQWLQTMCLWRLGQRAEALKVKTHLDIAATEAELEKLRPAAFADIERRRCRHCNRDFPLRRGEACPQCQQTSGPRM